MEKNGCWFVLFIFYLFDLTILQTYLADLFVVIVKIIQIFPKKFIASKKCGFN